MRRYTAHKRSSANVHKWIGKEIRKINVGWTSLPWGGADFSYVLSYLGPLEELISFWFFLDNHGLCRGAPIQRLWDVARVPQHFNK